MDISRGRVMKFTSWLVFLLPVLSSDVQNVDFIPFSFCNDDTVSTTYFVSVGAVGPSLRWFLSFSHKCILSLRSWFLGAVVP